MKQDNENFNLWLSGFIDGEGCFSISCRFRERNKLGVEIQPSFSVAQKKSEGHMKLLTEIRNYFNTGSIRGDKNCYKYETRKLEDILKIIIPFFDLYPLKTDKQKDFLIFRDICSRIQRKEHLLVFGLSEILELLCSMNSSKTRRFSINLFQEFLKDKAKKNLKNKTELF